MPNLSSNKNKWSLPTFPPPVETVCIPVTVPDDPRWIGLFLGAIYRLTQQVWYDRDEAHTARQVAAVWQDIYLTTVRRVWGCEGSEVFDIRVSPVDECLIEKTTDGLTWVEAFRLDTDCALTKIIRNPNTGEYGWEVEDVGFYRFPDGPYVPNAPVYAPPPRVRTGDEATERCAAAYAAALVLQSLYQQTWDVFTTTMAESALSFSKALIDLFEVIPALSIPLDWMLERAEDGLEGSANFVQGGFPDGAIESIQNILFCRATVTGGRVVFDHAGVLSDFQAEIGSPYDGLAFLLFLYVTEDMLNAAGNVDAGIGNCAGADCDPCSEWDQTDAVIDTYNANNGIGILTDADGVGILTYSNGQVWTARSYFEWTFPTEVCIGRIDMTGQGNSSGLWQTGEWFLDGVSLGTTNMSHTTSACGGGETVLDPSIAAKGTVLRLERRTGLAGSQNYLYGIKCIQVYRRPF